MSVRITRTSRLVFGSLLRDSEGVQYLDLLRLPPLEPQTDDVEHVVDPADRLDSIAQRYYSDSKLQWVIAHANKIDLWPLGLVRGSTLRIPSPRYVLQVWLAKARPRTR